jgi:hypothetical protein
MFTSRLTKEEILKRIEEEYEALSHYTENARESELKEFEQARLNYLITLMNVLEITEGGN